MQSFKEISAVNCLISKPQEKIVLGFNFDETNIFKNIEENFRHFALMQTSPNGHLSKLAFISSLLRDFHKTNITVEQSFEATLICNIEEKFTCTFLAEPIHSDLEVKRHLILNKFAELKTAKEQLAYEENSISIVAPINMQKVHSYWGQKHKVKELFLKIYSQLNYDEDAATALTSYILFEIEEMSATKTKNTLHFYEMYDLSNPFDKWFAAIDIQAQVTRIEAFLDSVTVH